MPPPTKTDQRLDAFYRPFDLNERVAIEAFASRIESAARKVDVIVVIARRAWCLISALKMIGGFRTSKPIISDRTLDWGRAAIAGKSVLVVDDCIVNGRMLAKTLKRLSSASAVHLEVLAFNRDRAAQAHVQAPPEALALSTQQTSELCSNIVDAFSLLPIPYSTDFPLYTNLPLNRNLLFRILHAPEWAVHDLSTDAQVAEGVFNYSFLPSLPLRQHLQAKMGLELPRDSLVKVRLLGRDLIRPKSSTWTIAVPMVVLPAIGAADLDRILEPRISHWLTHLPTPVPESIAQLLQCTEPECYKAKFRLLGALLATDVMKVFAAVLETNYGISLKSAKLSGVEHLIDAGAADLFALYPASVPETQPKRRTSLLSFPASQPLSVPGPTSPGSSLFEALMSPFTNLYRANEAAAKGDLFSSNQAAVLSASLSLQDLRTAAKNFGDHGVDLDSAISVFLDDAVDRGFVVPETHWQADLKRVSRGYRYGENLLFNHEDQALLACMLKEFFAANREFAPTATDMHKVLSLLLRFGFKYNLFRPCTPELANKEREWISRKFWLHGVVPVVTTTRGIVVKKPDVPLLERLEGDHYIQRQGKRYGVGTKVPDLEHFDLDRINRSVVVGSLLGEIYYRYTRNSQRTKAKHPSSRLRRDENELILLSTCLDANDTLAAMAAEAEYLVERWGYAGTEDTTPGRPLPLPEFIRGVSDDYTPKQHDLFLQANRQALRRSVRMLKVPLHSALWKYRSFRSGRCERIATKCERSLPSPRDKATWRELIGNYRPYREEISHQLLGTHLQRAASFFAKLGFLWSIVELKLLIRTEGIPAAIITNAFKAAQSDPTEQLWLNFEETQFTSEEESDVQQDVVDALHKAVSWMELFSRLYKETADVHRHELIERYRSLPHDFTALSLVTILRETETLLKQESWEIVWISNDLHRDVMDPARVARSREFLIVDLCGMELPGPDAATALVTNYVVPYNNARPNAKLMTLQATEWPVPGQVVLVPSDGNPEVAIPEFILFTLTHLRRHPCPLSFTILGDLPVRYSAYYSTKSSRISCGSMGEAMLSVQRHRSELKPGQILLLTAQETTPTNQQIVATLERNGLKAMAAATDPMTDLLRQATGLTWRLSCHPIPVQLPTALRSPPLMQRHGLILLQNAPLARVTVGIITVVSTETMAVHEVMRESGPVGELMEGRNWAGPFFLGKMQLADGTLIDVVQHQCTGEGQQAALDAFTRVVDEFQPEFMFLVGIAGGVHPKVGPGDVIFGQSVIYLEPGVYEDGAHKSRTTHIPKIPECMIRMLQKFELVHGEEHTFTWRHGGSKVFRGAIGSSESVVKDETSRPRVLLKLICENARAIEMEGEGFAFGFESHRSRKSGAPRGWLIVRGISDQADRNKNDGPRRIAAQNAASAFQELLRSLSSQYFETLKKASP